MATDPADATRHSVTVERELEPIEHEWDELADRVAAPPFLRPGWVRAWWDAFGAGRLELITQRRDGTLAGLVPLYRPAKVIAQYKTEPLPVTARRGTLRAIVNWHVPEFGIVAEDGTVAASLARASVSDGARVLSLPLLDPARRELTYFREAAEAAGYRTWEDRLSPSPYVMVEGAWEAYEEGVGRRLLRDLRRRRRRLEEKGPVTVEVADGRDRLDDLVEEGFRIEPSGWKAERGAAIASRPETLRFYREIGRWAAERGWLRLAFLRVGGRAAAFQFGLEHGGQYYFLKGGFDPAFERFAPAKLLVHEMLSRAFSIGLSRYNFLGGNESWKLEWTSTCRERLILHAFAPTLPGTIERVLIAHGRPLRNRARARLQFLRPALRRIRR
jgi:CelD/BcsL family acetyltransferase involved in cellulose biosynthesis